MKLEPLNSDFNQIPQCFKCGSIFIEDGQCEACGMHTKLDRLGGPFGAKSYYSLRHNYWCKQFWWVKLWPILEINRGPFAREYQRKLFYRYKALIYLLKEPLNSVEGQAYYLELGYLIEELIELGADKKSLMTEKPDLVFPHIEDWVSSFLSQKLRPKKAVITLNFNRSLLKLFFYGIFLLLVSYLLSVVYLI